MIYQPRNLILTGGERVGGLAGWGGEGKGERGKRRRGGKGREGCGWDGEVSSRAGVQSYSTDRTLGQAGG